MNTGSQIFQTSSRRRWQIFTWLTRSLLLLLLLTIPVVLITLWRDSKPALPAIDEPESAFHQLLNPSLPAKFTKNELLKYRGFNDFLAAKKVNEKLSKKTAHPTLSHVRAAFYVDWDPQSFYSLQNNIDKLNMVIPEWFFIDPATDTLKAKIDFASLELMRKKHIKIVPLINNINEEKGEGEFDGAMLHRILHNPAKRKRLINDISKYLRLYQLQGVNIDFEEFTEKRDEPIVKFQTEVYQALHPLGYLVTQDIMPNNEDFDVKKLSACNDYIFLMAYDEHYATSSPGPVCSQQWIEKVLDETAAEIPSEKIIVCIAGYGYDWPADGEAATITYQQALVKAKQYHAKIKFDNNNYNNQFTYQEANGRQHQVFFTDAATNFNTLRFADQYGTAGTALWRLGSEDGRLWTFYNRSLSNESMQQCRFPIEKLQTVNAPFEKPDYIGDGEVLNVLSEPEKGKIALEEDSSEQLITEEHYLQLPTKYVIRKYGNVHGEVVLTFDDGPEAEYTPKILDILKKEKIPAAFFVVGMQAEQNLPLLKRIAEEGYEIGNHTFTHPNIATVSKERAVSEMETTRLLIEAVTGKSTVLFRAPYNADAEPSSEVELKPIAISKQKNYYTIGESIDPNDWEKGVTADSIYRRTVSQYEANPEKGIILLHDAGGNRQATVDALPRIIHYFKSKGIRFTTVAHILGKSKNDVMPVVNSPLLSIDGNIAGLGYWSMRVFNAAFWTAIVLGMLRILIMGIMALLQRSKKRTAAIDYMPAVTIVVPAYNESVNAVKTIRNLLRSDYPLFDIVFVDDGSRDDTFELVTDAFSGNEKVQVVTKRNGGKASALNYGIRLATSDFVICIDADTQLNTDAVRLLMQRLVSDPQIGAVAGNVKVGNEKNILTKWQSIEYTTAQNFDRRAFDLVNGITVVPGAIGAFRKTAINDAGGLTTDTLAEDCDLTIRVLRSGYKVINCNEAVAITEAPETLNQFMKQRFRWSYGIMQAFWKHRDACFNPAYKGLGLLALPNILVFQILLPILAPLADLMLIFSLIWNRHDASSLQTILLYYAVFLLIDITIGAIALIFEKENLLKLFWLIPQRFFYRQMMYVILFRSIIKAIKGDGQGWGVLKRTGGVKELISVNC